MEDRTSLSLMSANLWNLNEPLRERMERFSDAVSRFSPDVIAMQEVCPRPGSRSRLQLDLVAALADYHIYYAVTHIWDEGAEGLAIASRAPAIEAHAFRLPGRGHSFEPDRSAQYVRIPWGAGGLGVFNTHLAYHHTSGDLRRRQAEFVGELAHEAALRRPEDGLVVCGDMNATPESEPISRLRSIAGLDDPWLSLSREKHSFATSNPYVGSDPDQDSWLDYIFTRNVSPSGLQLLDEWPAGPASDHYFPLVEIALP